jgi:hypothetical protein
MAQRRAMEASPVPGRWRRSMKPGATPQRRTFLAALSAFVATPAALTAVPALEAKPEPVEAPELLVLDEELRARLAVYREAAARLTAACENYERIKPALPAELIVPPGADRWSTDHP